MDSFVNLILNNVYWIFSGIGVLVITILINRKTRNKEDDSAKANEIDSGNQSNNIILNGSSDVVVNVGASNSSEQESAISKKTKASFQILFVDDEKFEIIDILKKAGWVNTKRVKNITDLKAVDIINADVVFVDVNGVGQDLFPKDQGLGLAVALKELYGEKKKIVLYSAADHSFSRDLNKVDLILAKNADPYEFISFLDSLVD